MGISINNNSNCSGTAAIATGKSTAIDKPALNGATATVAAAGQQITNNSNPGEKELQDITKQLNSFMQSLNTNIHFELHRETETLMVQVEDSQTHKIIKEVPSSELLDMVAKLRECIGAFVDKKV